MSHDQRPGKIRVVDGSGSAGRRRGDAKPMPHALGPATRAAGLDARAVPSPTTRSRMSIVAPSLFLLGCVAGGAAFAALAALG